MALILSILLSLLLYMPAYAYEEEPHIPIAYTFTLDASTQQLRAVIDSAEPLHLYFFDLCDVAGESLATFEKRFAAGENSQNEALAEWDTSTLAAQKLAIAASVCRLGFFTALGPVYRDKAPLYRISAATEPAVEHRLYMPMLLETR